MRTKPPTFRSAVRALLDSLLLSTAKVGAVAVGVVLLLIFLFFPTSMCGCGPKWKAYVAAMKSDLRNLASAEEAYYADHETYVASESDLDYTASLGVSIHINQMAASY